MIKNNSLLLFITVIVTFGALLLYFNFQHLWQLEKHSVTIAVSKSPLSTPFYVAKSINAFENTCVKVEYDAVMGGQIAFSKVMNGEVDFGTSSDSVIAFQSLTEKSFVTHAMFVQSDNDVKLITRLSDNIETTSDLKGKKIGITKGSSSEYFFSVLLAIDGLSIDEVELYHYQPEQLISGFINKEVDAVVPWEPFAFDMVELFQNKIKIHDTKNLNTLSFNLISKTADDILVEKAKCVIQGLNLAIEYIASNPNKAKKIVMDELNLTPSFIDWVWPDYIFKLGLNQSLILDINSQAKWAIEMQMSENSKRSNINVLFDSRALLKVDPRAVNIPL